LSEFPLPKLVTVLLKLPNLKQTKSRKAIQADDVEEASPPSSQTAASGSQRLACHGRSSEHVGENETSSRTGGDQANVVRGDNLKVPLTECIKIL